MAGGNGWAALFWGAFKGSRNAMVLLDERRRHVEVNGAYLKLVGLARDELIGRPVWDLVVGGPQLSEREWSETIARGEFSGEAALMCADGTQVTIQYAGHTEVVTGERRGLFVALSTSRRGGPPPPPLDGAAPHAPSRRRRAVRRRPAPGG